MSLAPDPFPYDFFISHRGVVAAVAQEVADILEGEGYRVKLQDYDFAQGGHIVLDIHEALKQARHLLILHTENYDVSFWTQQEFANFLAAVGESGGERRIGLLRCDQSTPLGLFRGITFGNLVGVQDPAERRRIILKVARGESTGARPAPRIFGGTMPPENRLFTGRDDLLRAMHTALTAEVGAALTQVALRGLGGVGKTVAARACRAPGWGLCRRLVDHRRRSNQHPNRPRWPRPCPGSKPASGDETRGNGTAGAAADRARRRPLCCWSTTICPPPSYWTGWSRRVAPGC